MAQTVLGAAMSKSEGTGRHHPRRRESAEAPPLQVAVEVADAPASAAKHLQVNRESAKANRRDALRGMDKVKGKQLDESPPAMLRQPGEPASVRPIDPSDNMGSGASIGNQARDVPSGGWVIIEKVE